MARVQKRKGVRIHYQKHRHGYILLVSVSEFGTDLVKVKLYQKLEAYGMQYEIEAKEGAALSWWKQSPSDQVCSDTALFSALWIQKSSC